MTTSFFHRRRGVALVSVLAILVLVTALIVAFLVRAGTEGVASGNYRSTTTTRFLSDTAVNLVQASINEATTSTDGDAWASQPGAIRVFDDQGQLSKIYRLYSAASLSPSANDGSILANDIPPDKWAESPATWIDLNAPVKTSGQVDSSGIPLTDSVYPIIDPRDPTDPGTWQQPKVMKNLAGFSLDNVPGATALQPAPMPVRWLYVLEDGQIIAPSGTGKNATIPGARRDNPIVGRIAYWTDDETSKVNLNTAAGSRSVRSRNGAPATVEELPATWDVPRFRTMEDRYFADNQPVNKEYQRYPGHPATTDLSAIFRALGAPIGGYPTQAASGTSSKFFDILPRYNDNVGSKAATVNTTTSNVPPTVSLKTERLLTSVGELLYDENRGASDLTKQQVESGKFFLTAASRSPDLNLYGKPRISIWPIDTDYGSNPTASNTTKVASTFDKLLAFCATTGLGNQRKAYYFQRHDSTHPTNDYTQIQRNRDLYDYLQRLTAAAIPGFGGNFLAKYQNDRDQILTEILDYIRCANVYDHSIQDPATGNPIPRFTPQGNNARTGYGQVVPLKIGSTRGLGRMYTISEVGLLLIATADGNSPAMPNKLSGGVPQQGYKAPETLPGYSAPVSPVKGSANNPQYVSNLPVAQFLRRNDSGDGGNGTVVDINGLTGTSSAVPFPVNPTLADTYPGTGSLPPSSVLPEKKKRLQAMLLFELSSPMQGYDPMMPDIEISVSNLDTLRIAGQRPFPTGALKTASPGTRLNYINQAGGLNGFQYFASFLSWGNNLRRNGWSNGTNPYQFVSRPFTVDVDSNGQASLPFGHPDGEYSIVELTVKQKGSTNRNSVQSFNLKFPETSVPTPDLIQYGLTATGTPTPSPADWWGFDKRIEWLTSTPFQNASSSSPLQGKGCVIRVDPIGVNPGSTVPNWNYGLNAAVPVSYFKTATGAQLPSTSQRASDVVRSLIVQGGDTRLAMANDSPLADGTPNAVLTVHPGYFLTDYKLVHSFMQAGVSNGVPGADLGGKLVAGANYSPMWAPKVPSNLTPQPDWDWDTGSPGSQDGAYSNKPDEGNIYTSGGASPYYWSESQANNNSLTNIDSYFTANRIMPSAAMFGSLPTGVKQGVPWRTLLFRPQMNRPRDPNGPKDHLLLDLFSMPVVEPYAISEPFSTAGRVNMNYQIVPFTYITRNTALRAVLSSETMARIPKAAAAANSSTDMNVAYKVSSGARPGSSPTSGGVQLARLPLNLDDSDGTLRQFREKFENWEIFKSASEICDIYLTPKDGSRYSWGSDAAADSSWYGDDFALVGDNVRERPYANIYPRLTTKSNTFTVHYTVQALKNPSADPAQWIEGRGVVTGEYRGSTTLERFLNPHDNSIPDYATEPNAASLDNYYQWRVVSMQAFAP